MPQLTLFAADAEKAPRLSLADPPPCPDCGSELVRTSERWFACPNGHRGLIPAPRARVAMAEREERKQVNMFARSLREWIAAEDRLESKQTMLPTSPPKRCPNCNCEL